ADPGREVEAARGPSGDPEAELQRPEAGIDDRRVGGVPDLPEEVARVEIERVDHAVAEIADEERVVEVAESLERRPRHAPRRVELSLAGEPVDELAVRVEDVHEAVARAGDVVLPVRVLLGVGHVQLRVDRRDSEGRESLWDLVILEASGDADRLEVRI